MDGSSRFGVLAAGVLIGFHAVASGVSGVPVGVQPEELAEVEAPGDGEITLKAGDAAPALEVTQWLQGEPVGAFEPGMVYVIDFFASWAPAAGEGTRALSRVHVGMHDRARVVGIASLNESRGETAEAVARFIEQQGSALRYAVAFDSERLMFARYMEAAGQAGVPHSFVVDGEGRIAWRGHPMDPQLPAVVDLVVKGEWSIEAYQRLLEEQQRADAMMADAVGAWNAGEREKTVELLQAIFEISPTRFGQHAVWKFHALHVEMGESDRAYEYARELIEGPMRESADPLADLAWVVLEAPPERTYDDIVAEMAARRALALTGEQHGHAWAAVAIIESRRQNFDEAMAAWEQALVFVDNEYLEGVYQQKRAETEREREEAIRGG